MPKIDYIKLEMAKGRYLPSLAAYSKGITDNYVKGAVGDKVGLTQFGVNRAVLEPGAGTSMRHWHVNQDEFVIVVEGTVTLIDDDGEHQLQAGDCAGFKAGDANGHHIINKSDKVAILFEIGTRTDTETAYYADHDLMVTKRDGEYHFTRKNGEKLPD
ncbi:MAG: cupin domain-containing protein [Candidatus Puniceispirillum sp.]